MTQWKLLLSAGLFGLLISSMLVIIVIYRLGPLLQSRRQRSLRDHHAETIPRFGGIGIAWGFLLSLLLFWWLPFDLRGLELQSLSSERLLGLCLGGAMAWGLGLADDVFQIRAHWKLIIQIVIGLVALSFGFELQTLHGPLFQSVSLGIWSWPLTLLWIIGIMNAMNLIDGLDGLASGLGIIALSCFTLICWWQGQLALFMVVAALLGALLGFWAFNRPHASIFMGDSGSLFLGYTLALLSIWATEIPGRGATLLPLLILAIPILDTAFSIFRRFLKGIPFYSADKDHLHHRLIAKGFSPTQALILLYGVSIIFGSLALLAHRLTHLQGFAYPLGVLLAYLLLFWLNYDVVRNPFSSLRGQSDHRKRRNLMLTLAEQIDSFLAKDPDRETVLRSFQYWSELAGVSRLEVRRRESIFWKDGPKSHSHRMLLFQQGTWEVRLGLPESSWTIDSDVKGELLERVSFSLINRLEQLETSTVLPLQRPKTT